MYVAWQGFPEPILTGLLALAVAALAGSKPRRLLAGILLGLAVGTKQFALGVLPFLVRTSKGRVVLAVAITVAAIAIIPMGLWHPTEFAEGAFWSHVDEPGRPTPLTCSPGLAFCSTSHSLLVLPGSVAAGWWAAFRFLDADSSWLAGSQACSW